jgi:uncharacterized Zn finger protein
MNPALKTALESITERGISLKNIVEVSAPLRVERAREVSFAGRVRAVQEFAEYISAQVPASTNQGTLRAPYTVSIFFERNRVHHHSCNCPDHGTSGACKHVIALALTWMEKIGRPVYRALKKAERIN